MELTVLGCSGSYGAPAGGACSAYLVRAGDSMTFLARGGRSVVQYQASLPATIEICARAYVLPATAGTYGSVAIEIDRDGRVELKCLAGAINLDRMDHE